MNVLDGEPQAAEKMHTEIRVKGKNVLVPSAYIQGCTVIATDGWLKIAVVQDEDLVEGEPLAEPPSFIGALRKAQLVADLFTFVQKLPDVTPKYSYRMEWDNLAVIPITTYAEWWEKRVEPSVRRAVRKAAKSGVVVRTAQFNDDFVQGIVEINNETPVRQGKPFWHYRKSFAAVKEEHSTYAERNEFLGAYFEDQLVGYMRLTYVGKLAHVIQILSMVKHFDKRLANGLIAKAVEVCERRAMTHLVYCNYVYNDPSSSLTEFKRRNGFEQILLPRYYIPLTLKGRIAMGMGLHRGPSKFLPQLLVAQLLRWRNAWYARKAGTAEAAI